MRCCDLYKRLTKSFNVESRRMPSFCFKKQREYIFKDLFILIRVICGHRCYKDVQTN